MGEIQLTKLADYVFCIVYKECRERMRAKIPRDEAKMFDHKDTYSLVDEAPPADVDSALTELSKKRLIKLWTDYSFSITDEGFIYNENRFKKGLSEVLDWIAKLKDLLF